MNAITLALSKTFTPADFDPDKALGNIGCGEAALRDMEASIRRAKALFAAARRPELADCPDVRYRLLLLADYAAWAVRSGFRLSSPEDVLRAFEAAVEVCSALPFDHPARTAVEDAN